MRDEILEIMINAAICGWNDQFSNNNDTWSGDKGRSS